MSIGINMQKHTDPYRFKLVWTHMIIMWPKMTFPEHFLLFDFIRGDNNYIHYTVVDLGSKIQFIAL